jgi:hypothetical protein
MMEAVLIALGAAAALVLAVLALGRVDIDKLLRRDIAALPRSFFRIDETILRESDADALPEPIARYLRFSGAVGRPKPVNFLLGFEGGFSNKRGAPMMPVITTQFNSCIEPFRLFYIRAAIGPFTMHGRDSYVSGEGRMWGKLQGLIPMFDESGYEFRVGELTTWLNDLVLVCPGALAGLGGRIRWFDGENGGLGLSLADSGIEVKAELFFSGDGGIANYVTSDRFMERAGGRGRESRYARTKWSTPVEGPWIEMDGRRLPSRGRAFWHPDEAGFCYADFRTTRYEENSRAYTTA